MFILFGLVMGVVALLEIINNNCYKVKFFVAFVIMLTLMLCLRYGQGTDYLAYEKSFISVNAKESIWANSLYHGELGWYMLMVIAKRAGMSFEMFVGVLSLVMMGFTSRVIFKYSPYKIVSLFILYPTFYLTYYYSALRQGLVLSLFLGLGIEWLIDKKYVKYFFLIFILIFFHKSAIILFALPFVKKFKCVRLSGWVFVALIFALFIRYFRILDNIAEQLSILSYFEVNISYSAILLRSLLFYIAYKLHKFCLIRKEDRIEKMLYDCYTVGFILYMMLAFSATLSQRMTMPLKATEILLFPVLVYKVKEIRAFGQKGKNKLNILIVGRFSVLLCVILLFLMLSVEMVKNINSYTVQGNYYSWVTAFNYPYISVFDKKKILDYRSVY